MPIGKNVTNSPMRTTNENPGVPAPGFSIPYFGMAGLKAIG